MPPAKRKAPTPPPPGERAKRPPKGKSKQRRYALTFCRFTDDSTDEENHRVEEVRSTSVTSAHTALVKVLKTATGRDDIKKNQIVLIEAALIPARTSLEKFLYGPAVEEPSEDGEPEPEED